MLEMGVDNRVTVTVHDFKYYNNIIMYITIIYAILRAREYIQMHISQMGYKFELQCNELKNIK